MSAINDTIARARARDPVASVLWRSLNAYLRLRRPLDHARLSLYDPRLEHTIYVRKAVTVLKLLYKYRPRCIVELGSGESSSWFASYATTELGVDVLSIDEWPEWQERTTEVAREIGGVDFIVAKKIHEPPNGYRYDFDLPRNTDFIFIDGPYHQTHEVGLDAIRFLQQGGKPKVICVDGRTSGVDALRLATASSYDFYPQMIWCFERRRLLPVLAMRAQSVFVRKG